MIHRIVIELTDEIGGYEEELEHLERVYGAEELPIGEWIKTDNRWGVGDWLCSNCESYSNTNSNFCPNCGAQMKNVRERKMTNTEKCEELFNHLLNAMQIAKDLNNDEIFEVLSETGSTIADIIDKN